MEKEKEEFAGEQYRLHSNSTGYTAIKSLPHISAMVQENSGGDGASTKEGEKGSPQREEWARESGTASIYAQQFSAVLKNATEVGDVPGDYGVTAREGGVSTRPRLTRRSAKLQMALEGSARRG